MAHLIQLEGDIVRVKRDGWGRWKQPIYVDDKLTWSFTEAAELLEMGVSGIARMLENGQTGDGKIKIRRPTLDELKAVMPDSVVLRVGSSKPIKEKTAKDAGDSQKQIVLKGDGAEVVKHVNLSTFPFEGVILPNKQVIVVLVGTTFCMTRPKADDLPMEIAAATRWIVSK